ncbi:MAG TPA: PAS domain S-box protein [Kiloniellales bacterium]|nr:PAS domain S-box protein [Kiloniellales bacterium]
MPGQIVLPVGTAVSELAGSRLRGVIMRRSERLGAIGHWIWDETCGCCVHCSEELARIYELSVAEYFALRGDNAKVYATLHPEDRERYRTVTEGAYARGEPYEIEFRVITRTGALRYCYEAAEQIVDESGAYLGTLGVVQDVTATKEIEAELRHAKDALGELFQSLALPVFVLDDQGRVSFWNRAAERVFGWRAGEVVGQPVPLLPEETGFPLLPFLQRQLAREGARPLEVTWRRRDGSSIPLSISLSTVAGGNSLAVVAVDLTEQRAAERQVVEQGEQLRVIVESLPVPVVITRASDGVVLFANDVAKLSFGHTPGVTNLRSGDDFWTETDRARFLDELDSRGRVAGAEICFRRRDGTPFLAVVTAEPLSFGGVDALMSVALDVTEQRRAAEELRHAQRLEAVGQLTGGIAHDFNNLLTVVLGNAEALANDPTLGDGNRRLAQIIADTAERGANLTRQLLAFARRQSLNPSLVQVDLLIEDTARLLRRTMAAAIEIETRLQPDLPTALVDRSQLETALINLVLNARDAMPKGGRIVLEAEMAKPAPGRGGRKAPQLELRVIDDGSGMTPEVLRRAFEPFFTTKEVGQGSGLGLSMVYGFAAQSGGSVQIESEPGRGTVVHLYLPVAEPVALRRDAHGAPPENVRGEERILLVEDEPLVREFVSGQLEHLGYQVTAVEQGTAALTLLQGDDRFDLLLTDNIMPGGISGIDLRRQARQLHPRLRVLLMSGYAGTDLDEQEQGERLLRKPFNRRQLAEAVRLALEESSAA